MENLKDWELLMRVASNGSMNQTAAELDLSIATVSQKIKDIEAVLGYPIFERTTKKTRLTPEGVQLLAAAKNPLDSFKSFVSDIHSADRMKKSTSPAQYPIRFRDSFFVCAQNLKRRIRKWSLS
ncbi:LysR family transcriptional regulator [uncultured Parasutterella sp.]|uniref:LysR family transcriptional regulator n=1 Tax=uncultured Parasutterella sp. TaxID=1263098 RepID=UPI00345D3962